MGGFGNEMGALFGGTMYGSKANNWSNEDWNALMGTDKPENYWDQIDQDNVAELSNDSAPEDADAFDPSQYESQLGTKPGVLTDTTAYDEVRDKLTGGDALNWEEYTFGGLRDEKNSLNPTALRDLSTAWKDAGDDLKTSSEDFKKSVQNLISGKWSGESAGAAEAASEHVTENSIYEFTPSSEALSDRLTVLAAAFEDIRTRFPDGQGTVEDFHTYDKVKLDAKVHEYNTKYHFSSEGHLQLSNGQYVDPSTAIDERNRIQQSINDYHDAVQLFRDSYEPTVAAVTQNFPMLPPPPNMEFKPPGPDPTGPGPTGPGPTGPGPTGPGPTGPGIPPFNTPKFDTPPTTTPDTGKPPEIPDYPPPGTSDQPPIGNPPNWPQNWPTPNPSQPVSQGLKAGLDAATQGMKSGLDAASQAAQKAAQGAAGAGQKPPSLREGALGLGDRAGGPKGLGGGAAGAGAGGSGGLPAQQPAARLSTESASGARPAVPAASTSSMGAMGGMGAPGMGGGGPAAGGKGADGKEHKANKALKRRKNGSDIVGDTDAVVPVVGGESAPPPEDKDSQPAPRRRRIPGRDGSGQPDSAVQSGPRRSPQTEQPGATPADQLMDQ